MCLIVNLPTVNCNVDTLYICASHASIETHMAGLCLVFYHIEVDSIVIFIFLK